MMSSVVNEPVIRFLSMSQNSFADPDHIRRRASLGNRRLSWSRNERPGNWRAQSRSDRPAVEQRAPPAFWRPFGSVREAVRAVAAAAPVSIGLATFALAPSHAAEPILLACGKTLDEVLQCFDSVQRWPSKKNSNNPQVIILPMPFSSSELRKTYENFGENSWSKKRIDILEVDIIDVPNMASEDLILNLSKDLKDTDKKRIAERWSDEQIEKVKSPAIYKKHGKDDKYAIPYFTDVSLLFENTQIIDNLETEIEVTTDNGWRNFLESLNGLHEVLPDEVSAFTFQTANSEAIIANFFEWVYENEHPDHQDKEKFLKELEKILTTKEFRDKLELLHRIAARNKRIQLKNDHELTSIDIFGRGSALFMRNWPFAFGELEKFEDFEADSLEVQTLPRGQGSGSHGTNVVGRGTLGGWYFAIAADTPPGRRSVLLDLVLHLTSKDEQRRRALKLGLLPTFKDLYDDPAVQARFGGADRLMEIRRALDASVSRPAQLFSKDYRARMDRVAKLLADFFDSEIADGEYTSSINTLSKNILEELSKTPQQQ